MQWTSLSLGGHLNKKVNKIDNRIINAKITFVSSDNEKSHLNAMAETIYILSRKTELEKGEKL